MSLMKMESRLVGPAVSAPNDGAFNAIQFEKKLMQLKDSQESIQTMSSWCLENRMHHKKIVNAWLSVLKKVKVEQRLTLFYLANDVIQYSKRRNFDFVESWGTTLQKATTLVREEKVKNKILRIFKIWEQRGIYGEEFITDLSGLISASPSVPKINQDPQDFQPTNLINRIRNCTKLEADTDSKLKILQDKNPKIIDSDTLCASLKDRRHVEDVEKEVENGIALYEAYVNALKAEIKSRTHLIACLTQADLFYSEERKEVKVVVNAYKNFTTRVRNLQKKLDELKPTLISPIPSPDVNAPSPPPDLDIDLPSTDDKIKTDINSGLDVFSLTETYNANYYTSPSASASHGQDNFASNGFSSFMGSNMSFDLQNFNTSNIFTDRTNNESAYNLDVSLNYDPQTVTPSQTQPPPISTVNYNSNTSYDQPMQSHSQQPPPSMYNQSSLQPPLLPPPMPPFTTSYMDSVPYTPTDSTYAPTTDTYANNSTYEPINSTPYSISSSEIQPTYGTSADAYNPEEEIETWDPETTWDAPPDLETPESPPMFEKESFVEPIEYDDSKNMHAGLSKDVDHRILIGQTQLIADLGAEDTDLRVGRMGSIKDIDHRNLISLTGSPTRDSPSPGMLQPPPAPPALWSSLGDQDYRTQDQDYRDIAQQLQLPPPPPPPSKLAAAGIVAGGGGITNHDNVESIDMELSDDESNASQSIITNNVNDLSSNGNGSNGTNIISTKQINIINNQNITNSIGTNIMHSGGGCGVDNNNIVTLVESCVDETLEPPPPIPQHLQMDADMDMNDAVGGGGGIHNHMMPPLLPDGPWPPAQDGAPWMQGPPRDFPPFPPDRFRGGFRGRGNGGRGGGYPSDNGERFWGHGSSRGGGGNGGGAIRNRPFRGGGGSGGGGNQRGNFNNKNRGLRGSGFRGKFRGGF